METQSSSSSSMGETPTPTPTSDVNVPKGKDSFVRRYKFFLPLILSVNLAVGAYLFMRTKKKDIAVDEETTDAAPIPPSSTSGATPTTIAVTESLPIARFTRAQEPISEQQQRELFKWMLEDKRKIKTVDPEEKKRIDEEKAILKQFLRAKSIPSI
ncbi:uncharacterized protein LOC104900370 isoform X2 [Beta vulgaris subsp. vulgaris]|nr:uncharacterized protein LOC104900370 isoform X2 [Beta vulgaris subsp. vulgaris]